MLDLALIAGLSLIIIFLLILGVLLSDSGTRAMASRGLRRRGGSAMLTIMALSVGTAVIMSSLGVGDALKGLVVERADKNLNGVDVLAISADFVDAGYVADLRADPEVSRYCDALSPAFVLPVVLHNNVSENTISRATLYALDEGTYSSIGKFTVKSGGAGPMLEDGALALNQKASKELGAYRHQEIFVGLDSPTLRKETMFTEQGVDHINLEMTQIFEDEGMGRLQFNVQDVTPAAFTTLNTMQDALHVGNKMNAVLISVRPGMPASEAKEQVTEKLDGLFKTKDLHLKVTNVNAATTVPAHLRVTSDRVFFEEDILNTLIFNKDSPRLISSTLSTYFVDSLSLKLSNGTTSYLSYSTVTGLDPEMDSRFGLFNENSTNAQISGMLGPNDIGLTNWTAKELGAKKGDTINVDYSIMDDHFDLIKHSRNFTVAWIIDISGKANDPTLMPDYPGIQGIESCFKWDPPFPMDLSKIQPKDEAYWQTYKGVPKAYILFSTSFGMWGNDQGNLTMIKAMNTTQEDLIQRLDEKAETGSVGMSIVAIRAQLVSSASAMDIFLEMFLAFGTITITAAIIFVATTFRMMIDERKAELGTLRSIGISRRRIMRDLLGEGMLYALIAGIIGLALGWLATGALIVGLDTVWKSVVAGEQVVAHAFIPTYLTTSTLLLSLGSGLLLSLFTLVLLASSASKMSVMSARGLADEHSRKARWPIGLGIAVMFSGALVMSAAMGLTSANPESIPGITSIGLLMILWGLAVLSQFTDFSSFNIGNRQMRNAIIGLAATISSVIGAYYMFQYPPISSLALFVIEGLFITISLIIALVPLIWLIPIGTSGTPSPVAFSFLRSKGWRTASTIGIFGLIIFSIVSLSVIVSVQNEAIANAAKEQAGGFDVLAEATRPIGPDLSDQTSRQRLGINITGPAELFMARTVGTSGAVCSNMNPQYPPRLIGADDRFIQASNFDVASSLSAKGSKEAWASLDEPIDGRIPIMVDENTLIIYLGYAAYEGALGHVFTVDAETGRAELEVVGILAPSVIAGSFVMHDDFLKALYPTGAGYRLVFVKTDDKTNVISELEKGLASYGLDARDVIDIVRETTSAEQGYMSLFQVYLGAGLILGVVALAVTQAREVVERKRDIAMLRAVGLSRTSIGRVFYIEAAIIGSLSLAIGIVSGLLLAVTSGPAWGRPVGEGLVLPYLFIFIFSVCLMVIIVLAAAIPAARASKLAPISVLREE